MLEIIKAIMKHCTCALLGTKIDQGLHIGAIEYLCAIVSRNQQVSRDKAYHNYVRHCVEEPFTIPQFYTKDIVKEEPIKWRLGEWIEEIPNPNQKPATTAPFRYNPSLFDSDGYMQVMGFGKIHINNFRKVSDTSTQMSIETAYPKYDASKMPSAEDMLFKCTYCGSQMEVSELTGYLECTNVNCKGV